MAVGELIEMLEDYPKDAEIVVRGGNSIYAEAIDTVIDDSGVRAYWGDDYPAIVISCGIQVGAVWQRDDLGFDGDIWDDFDGDDTDDDDFDD